MVQNLFAEKLAVSHADLWRVFPVRRRHRFSPSCAHPYLCHQRLLFPRAAEARKEQMLGPLSTRVCFSPSVGNRKRNVKREEGHTKRRRQRYGHEKQKEKKGRKLSRSEKSGDNLSTFTARTGTIVGY